MSTLLGIIIVMVDYDPHITGLRNHPENRKQPGDLFSLFKCVLLLLMVPANRGIATWALQFKQTSFLLKKKTRKKLPHQVFGRPIFFASAQAAFHFTTFSFDDATYSANFAVAFNPFGGSPMAQRGTAVFFTDFP